MQAIWNRIEDTVERIDHHTYGFAKALVVVVTLGSVAIAAHFVFFGITWSLGQLFNLIAGSI